MALSAMGGEVYIYKRAGWRFNQGRPIKGNRGRQLGMNNKSETLRM